MSIPILLVGTALALVVRAGLQAHTRTLRRRAFWARMSSGGWTRG